VVLPLAIRQLDAGFDCTDGRMFGATEASQLTLGGHGLAQGFWLNTYYVDDKEPS